MDKKASRMRRARRGRMKIRELGAHRLSVHRTPRHIYAQVISPTGSEVIASASSRLATRTADGARPSASYAA